jgi:hypothetical protein
MEKHKVAYMRWSPLAIIPDDAMISTGEMGFFSCPNRDKI